jgi:YgiT-type zinc finger domain-containing protein
MTCVICRQAAIQPGLVTVTLDRPGITLVVKKVPARVCPNCGEEYVDEAVTAHLLRAADSMARAGAQVDVRDYVPG